MATDPRLGAAALGVEDPVQRIIAGLSARISELEKQVRTLQTTPTIQQLTGAPTAPARDGTCAADTTSTGKFWVRINGTWRFVALT